MKLQLLAKISDTELLRKSVHKLGTVFYHMTARATLQKCFSGCRVVEFVGKVDEFQGFVRIVQQG